MRLDRCCSVVGKGSLSSLGCIFYTTYWQFRDMHTWGNDRKRRPGGLLEAQVSCEPFQELQHKRQKQDARWCYRLLWMCAQVSCRACASTELLSEKLSKRSASDLITCLRAYSQVRSEPPACQQSPGSMYWWLGSNLEKNCTSKVCSDSAEALLRHWTAGLVWWATGLAGALDKFSTVRSRKAILISGLCIS